MARFFVSGERISDGKIYITDADAHHIARSLRMAEGDNVTVCDGEGLEYLCTLERIRDDECVCSILEKRQGQSEPRTGILLCMAYPKGDKLETVIQKAVELGATEIIPFESSRCIKRPKADKAEKQTQRLQRIAEEAAKQCGRSRIPSVCLPLSLEGMLDKIENVELKLLCYENEDGRSIKGALPDGIPQSIAVIVGAEGGFSGDEAKRIVERGAVSVTLGKRILRCETAPSFALSAISYKYEL
jgi:16S rRNA (uracil1498-N3)-methyltransferase